MFAPKLLSFFSIASAVSLQVAGMVINPGMDIVGANNLNHYRRGVNESAPAQTELLDKILMVSDMVTGDPYITVAHGRYHLAPKNWAQKDVWAPELHQRDGKWWVFLTATRTDRPRLARRVFVLEGPPVTEDPTSASWNNGWEWRKMVQNMPQDPPWAIDGTMFQLNDEWYFVWSGKDWKAEVPKQELYICRMVSPTSCDPNDKKTHKISTPDLEWEDKLQEGPQFLESPNGKWKGIVYSAFHYSSPKYAEGALRYAGGDPLEASSWEKLDEPIMKGTEGGPLATGHGNFFTIGEIMYHVYHANYDPNGNGTNRKMHIQKLVFDADGRPRFNKGRTITDSNDYDIQKRHVEALGVVTR